MGNVESSSEIDPLPPYGLLNDTYLTSIREAPFPSDFGGIPGVPGTLEQQWIHFRTKTLEIIKEVLWPEFDYSGKWQGESASFMMELTRTDLDLLLRIRHAPLHLDQPVTRPDHSTNGQTHRQLFQGEDEDTVPIGSSYNQYDNTLPFRLLDRISTLFHRGLSSKCGTTHRQLKRVLQRPRAYQVALRLKHREFTYLEALSADSPSIPSGHCLQGTLGFGAVIERFLLDGEGISPDQWLALEQYTVDIGDRRVLAGVHYPADNICSWLIAMLLADYVYRTPQVKQKLWQAISLRSFVYRAIQDWVTGCKGERYKPALAALQAAAEGTLTV